MTDIIVLVFLILCIIGIRKKDGLTDGIFSADESVSIKGMMCVCIILHHLSLATQTGKALRLFSLVGYLAVAVFFFISGYGLSKKYRKTGSRYLKGFLWTRLGKIAVPFLICFIISAVIGRLCLDVTIQTVTDSFKNMDPFPYHSWYIWAALITYLLFWIGFKIPNKIAAVSVITFFCVVISVVCFLVGRLSNLSITILCFPLGVVFGLRDKELTEKYKINKRPALINMLISAFVFFSASVIIYISDRLNLEQIISTVVHIIAALSLCSMLAFIFVFITVKSTVMHFIGKHSFEIYMFHGIIYKLFEKYLPANTELLFVCLSIAVAILFGSGYSILYHKIEKCICKPVFNYK